MHGAPLALTALVCLAAPVLARGVEAAAQTSVGDSRVPLYRVFLTDGTSAVSYGEYARVGNEVVFSMPLGTGASEPMLQLITIPADWVDWARTERYERSVKFQRYVETRAESDFAALSAQVAAMLNDITHAEPARARAIAERARQLLAGWPAAHYGYRQDDVRELLALVDAGMAEASDAGAPLRLSLVARTAAVPVEPLLGMPTVREQVASLVTFAHRIGRPADRAVLLKAALTALDDPAAGMPPDDTAAVRRSLESQLREEHEVDERYTRLSDRLIADASRAASRADVAVVERTLSRLAQEDERLGGRRPQLVHALREELTAHLEAARDLQRRRADWQVRRNVYRSYVERVSVHVAQLVKVRGSLEGIRNLEPADPGRLTDLQDRLDGGAGRLEAIAVPDALRPAHEMLIGAWRFAEHAAERYGVGASGSDEARQASSAAAGALMLLAQAQDAMRASLDPPTLR